VARTVVRPDVRLGLDDPRTDPAAGQFANQLAPEEVARHFVRRTAEESGLERPEAAHRVTIIRPVKRTLLVTGGAGFIASHIVDDALAHGERVVVIDNLSTGRRENLAPGAAFHQMDLNDPRLDQVVGDHGVNVISHYAAQVNVRVSLEDPSADARTNILGTLALVRAAKKAGVRTFVFASSGGTVYGEQSIFPCDESHPLAPTSPYGCAKLSAELYLDAFRAIGDLEPVVFRYANIYGPRQEPKGEAGIVAILAEKLLAGETPKIFDDGEQTRDYVHVGDVVAAHRAAVEKRATGAFNVGTGVETSVNALYRMIAGKIGSTIRPRHVPPIAAELRRNVLDAGKLERELGAAPKTRLEDGLERTIPYYRERAAQPHELEGAAPPRKA
jgi:UDP-glucose 4-epimerase